MNRLKRRSNERLFRVIRSNLEVPFGSECLEIGCGTGDMAVRLFDAYRPRRYVATDYDSAQVTRARTDIARHNGGHLPETLELRTADALRLPFPDESFDVVFAFAVFHHVEDHFWRYEQTPRAVSEVHRLLRPGGRIVYEEWVHKPRIRDDLLRMGFRVDRWHRGNLGLSELTIATKAPRRRANKPSNSGQQPESRNSPATG